MTGAEPQPDPRYTPYQEEFFRRFVSDIQPGSVHFLVAPVGTGKSFAMAGTISELARTHRTRRTLLLAPAIVATLWADLLERRGSQPVVVDSRVLRLLREQLGDTPDDWPEGIYSLSIDLAKRPDVREFVCAVAWDLVVVDEAHGLSGQRVAVGRGSHQRRARPRTPPGHVRPERGYACTWQTGGVDRLE